MITKFYVILLALFTYTTLSSGVFLNAGELRSNSDVIAIYPDLGIKTVLDAQAGVIPAENDTNDVNDTETLLQNFMDGTNFMLGWNASDYNDTDVYFASGIGKFNTHNPSSDESFIENREIAVIEAVLRAKADVIASLFLADFKAEQRIDIPGTPEYTALEQYYEPFRQKLETLWEKMQREMPENDLEEAPLFSTTSVQLFNVMYTGLKSAADSGKIVTNKWADYKNAYEALRREYDVLVENAEKIQTVSTNVSAASKMPLVGGTVIYQAESWNQDTKEYSVGIVLCWSKQLQVAAFATLSNAPIDSSNLPKGEAMNVWLKNLDYSSTIGPRQFLDNEGRFHMVGISAMPVVKNAPRDNHNRRIADLNAQAMAMLALRADVELSSNSQALNTMSGIGSSEALSTTAVNLRELITQSYSGGSISGLQPRRRVKVKHFLSDSTMHVSVYSINAQGAARTMTSQATNAPAILRVHQNQNR